MAADSQTDGRGTRGRSFFCYDGGLYFSLVKGLDENAVERVTPLAAVAVSRAVEGLTGKKPLIKWVNDIYLDGKKICGILCQRICDGEGKERVIIGIGVNVTEPENGFPKQIKERAGAIFPCGQSGPCEKQCFKSRLCAETVNEIYGLFEKDGELILSEYKKRMFLLGREISFCLNGETFKATAEDIARDFSLLVRLREGETKHLSSGDVMLSEDTLRQD